MEDPPLSQLPLPIFHLFSFSSAAQNLLQGADSGKHRSSVKTARRGSSSSKNADTSPSSSSKDSVKIAKKNEKKNFPLSKSKNTTPNTLLLRCIVPLAFGLLLVSSVDACPEQVRALCDCVEHPDGALLNCTDTGRGRNKEENGPDSAIRLLNVLKASQTQLGLLKVLAIQRFPIAVLPRGFFDGLYIRRLDVRGCGMTVVEPGAFLGLETVLQELSLAGNLLREVPAEAIKPLQSLLKLDLSSNVITELRAEDSLPRMNRLLDINLSHNHISGIHKTFFDGLKHNVQTINLGHNRLREVPASALRGFRMLLALHMHNNELDRLDQLSFLNLPVLSLLNLAGNRIRTIHRQAFLNLPALRYLYLSGNQVNNILPHQFSQFEQLEMLDLSGNRLEVLGNDSFAELVSLKQLYLGENLIRSIEPYAFANCSVQVLVLEANQLTELTPGMLQGARQLQQLSLKRNRLRSIDANAFQHCPGLVMIDLSKNELLDLAPSTFFNQLGLLLVDVSANRLMRTPFAAFNRRIATVLLQENPLVCTERVHMLQQGTGVFVPDSPDLVCKRHNSPGGSNDLPSSSSSPSPMPEMNNDGSGKLISVVPSKEESNGLLSQVHTSNEFDVTDPRETPPSSPSGGIPPTNADLAFTSDGTTNTDEEDGGGSAFVLAPSEQPPADSEASAGGESVIAKSKNGIASDLLLNSQRGLQREEAQEGVSEHTSSGPTLKGLGSNIRPLTGKAVGKTDNLQKQQQQFPPNPIVPTNNINPLKMNPGGLPLSPSSGLLTGSSVISIADQGSTEATATTKTTVDSSSSHSSAAQNHQNPAYTAPIILVAVPTSASVESTSSAESTGRLLQPNSSPPSSSEASRKEDTGSHHVIADGNIKNQQSQEGTETNEDTEKNPPNGKETYSSETISSTAKSSDQSSPSPPPTTTEYQHPLLNRPGVIYPHPVPFLQPAPRQRTSYIVTQTLPPSIVLARPPDEEQQLSFHKNTAPSGAPQSSTEQNTSERGIHRASTTDVVGEEETHRSMKPGSPSGINGAEDDKQLKKIEKFEFDPNNSFPTTKEEHQQHSPSSSTAHFGGAEADFQREESSSTASSSSRNIFLLPNSVVFACLGLVGLVSSAVFVGLCVARQRQLRFLRHINARGDFGAYTPSSSSGAGTYMSTIGRQHLHGGGTAFLNNGGGHRRFPSTSTANGGGTMMGMTLSPSSGGSSGGGVYASCDGARFGGGVVQPPPRIQLAGPVQDDQIVYGPGQGWVYTPGGAYNSYRPPSKNLS